MIRVTILEVIQGWGNPDFFENPGYLLHSGSKATFLSYPSKQLLLEKMRAIGAPPLKVLVDDQEVDDIIDAIIVKHLESEGAYDQIYECFSAQGDWRQVASRIFNFLKRECFYQVEDEEWQFVSSPQVLLQRGVCDCKGYALFTAGIIDAMKRAGEKVDWTYRFASYNLMNRTPAHVFVVLWPGTADELWIDPVLPKLDLRWPRPSYWSDYVPAKKAKSLGKITGIGGKRIGISSAEQTLLNNLKEYSDGVYSGVQTSLSSGVLNAISKGVLLTASALIPVVGEAIAIITAIAAVIVNNFPVGSLASRLAQDWENNPLTAPVTWVESIFNGRTFESDQYRAAQMYQWYVLGNRSANALNTIPDSDVFPALKYFMDRFGVFISGAQHLEALATSPADYASQYSVNAYTTTDMNRVNAAYNIASKWLIFNNVLGSWAAMPGVYDAQLAEIALAQNETIEAAAAQADYDNVYSEAATSGPAPVVENTSGFTIPLIPLLLGLATLILLFQPSKKIANG
jgi:hypothetical protein